MSPKTSKDFKNNFDYVYYNQEGRKSFYHHRNTISWYWCIFGLIIGCLFYYLVHYNDHILPKVITIDELAINKKIFSGEQSRAFLRKLTSFGPRVVGEEANEIFVPNLIAEETEKIIREANKIHSIKWQKQVGSGAYTLFYKTSPAFTNVYDHITNMIVMVEGSVGDHSVMLNCHFDSKPEVEGASDDAISCAVMLEILRAISNDESPPKHNIVFLFNGAEEVAMQASHLFLQHEWSKKVRVFINLEAAGSGGRELLFQSGPKTSWLFQYYSKYAPHPHSLVLIEEMFQEGLIPSDTDFRIFRDFGNLRGLDLAFGRNGYLYHTKYDKEIYIPMGSHQHMGDNTLAMLRPLANAPELEDMDANSGGQMVFYDYIGWYMISYPMIAGVFMNITAVLLSILSMFIFIKRLNDTTYSFTPGKYFEISRDITVKSIILEMLIAFGARILGMILSIGIVAGLASIINMTAPLAMVWFSNVWLIFPLYWCPCLIVSSLVSHLIGLWRSKKLEMSPSVVTQMNLIVSQIPHMLALLFLTCFGYRSSSVLFLPVLASAVANLVIHLTPLYRSAFRWIWVYFLIQIYSFILSLYFVLVAYVTLIPLMGRKGVVNAELYIGMVSAILCIFLTTFMLPFMSMVRRSYIVYIITTIFSLTMILLSINTDIGFPYKAGPENPSPQRYWIMHSLREFRNDSNHVRRSESGYFILNQDINSPRTIPMKNISNIYSLKSDCNEELFCGLPIYTTIYVPLSPSSSWIPAAEPVQPTTTDVILKEKECHFGICSLSFTLLGPNRLTFIFSPRPGATLSNWTLPTEPVQSIEWNGNPAYVLHICRGLIQNDYEITLIFKVSNEQQGGKPIADVALVTNHVNHEKYRTNEFQEFLDSFPDWTDRTGWISAFKSYVY